MSSLFFYLSRLEGRTLQWRRSIPLSIIIHRFQTNLRNDSRIKLIELCELSLRVKKTLLFRSGEVLSEEADSTMKAEDCLVIPP